MVNLSSMKIQRSRDRQREDLASLGLTSTCQSQEGGLQLILVMIRARYLKLFVTRTKIMQGRATTLDLQSARPRRVNSESMTFSSITIFKLISVPILLQRIRSDDASFIYLPYIVFLL